MEKTELQHRTKQFAIAIIKLAEMLPNNRVGWTITGQIVRSATSVAANYRAVCRAKSDKDFISKMETVIEEADETLFWLELIEETKITLHKSQNHNSEIINHQSKINRAGETVEAKSIKLNPTKIKYNSGTELAEVTDFEITTFEDENCKNLKEYYEKVLKPSVDSIDYKENNVEITTKKATYSFDTDKNTLIKNSFSKRVGLR